MTIILGDCVTKNEFQSLCGKYLIDVGIALENPNIQGLLFWEPHMDKKEVLFEIEETFKNEF